MSIKMYRHKVHGTLYPEGAFNVVEGGNSLALLPDIEEIVVTKSELQRLLAGTAVHQTVLVPVAGDPAVIAEQGFDPAVVNEAKERLDASLQKIHARANALAEQSGRAGELEERHGHSGRSQVQELSPAVAPSSGQRPFGGVV
jgi:hypothetical protein